MDKKFHIQVVEDQAKHMEVLADILEEQGYLVIKASSAEESLSQYESGKRWDFSIIDYGLPGMNGLELLKTYLKHDPNFRAIILSGEAGKREVIEAFRIGALNYIEKSSNPEYLLMFVRQEYQIWLESEKVRIYQQHLDRKNEEARGKYKLVGSSPVMLTLMQEIEKAASHDAHVLITGESGTGKENAAHLIHLLSARRHKPFAKVNCNCFPSSLIASELFGNTKNAFTGAADRLGQIALADGGTLFIDEIGDLSEEVQSKLLEVVQSKEYKRLGEDKIRKSDFRLITATNKDLKKLVEDGRFRSDLFFRIIVVELKMPPLREHLEDIPQLVEHFKNIYKDQHNRYVEGFTARALKKLQNYDWLGNVRQLEKTIERAVLEANGKMIDSTDLGDLGTWYFPGSTNRYNFRKLQEVIKTHIEEALKLTDGNRSEAARLLGIAKSTLIDNIRSYNLDLKYPGTPGRKKG